MPNSIQSQFNFFKHFIRNKNFWIILATDIILIALAHGGAYLLRIPDLFTHKTAYFKQIYTYLPLLLAVKIPIFYFCGLYRGMWRYTSLNDLLNIVKASFSSLFVIVSAIVFIHRFQGFPRSVFIIDAILTLLLISAHRIIIRYLYQKVSGPRTLLGNAEKDKKRLLLIGAGDAAEQIIREIKNNPTMPYSVVGLVDDNPNKIGLKIHNVPVIGLIEDLPEHCQRIQAEEILIAISTLSGKETERLNRICRATQLEFKILPGLGELIDGRVSIKSMRDISYKDLLGRDEVRLDQNEIGQYLTGKTVMITGAGGSIGSELCRQVIRFKPAKIILFDASEENLYAIQMELIHELGFTNCHAALGKIQNFKLLNHILLQHKPSVIFHAAAYKHVPLLESNPWEAIFNNIKGSCCLVEASMVNNVSRFVLVSTDKAVRPTNVMGASKRLTELIMQACTQENWDGTLNYADKALKKHNTIFQAVRFGNVIGSSGSVIPLFKRQIELGGPVTVTDPEITRYFMSIEEAARLIIQAGAMGKGGELFILKMGQPVKIADMARDLIRLAGKEPDTEISIKYIGLRPGEKLYEELITEGEGILPTQHDKIMVLKGNSISYNEINDKLAILKKQAKNFDDNGIKETLKQLIPEYQPKTN